MRSLTSVGLAPNLAAHTWSGKEVQNHDMSEACLAEVLTPNKLAQEQAKCANTIKTRALVVLCVHRSTSTLSETLVTNSIATMSACLRRLQRASPTGAVG